MKQMLRILMSFYCFSSLSTQLYCSEFVAEALETAGIEDAEGVLNKGLTEGLVGEGAEAIDALSPEMQESLQENLTQALKENSAALQNGQASIESITKQTTDNFYKNVEQFGAEGKVDVNTQSALNKFNFEPDQLESINNIQERPSSALSTTEIGVEPTSSAETSLEINTDKLISAQTENISGLTDAQSAFDESLESLAKQNESLVSIAEGDVGKASENVDEVVQEGDADKTLEAQDAQDQAEQSLEDTKEVQKEGERLSNRQKLEVAQKKLETVETDLKTNQETLKQAKTELKALEDAPAELEKTKTALETATDEEKPALEQKVSDLETKIANKEQLSTELNEKITQLSKDRELLLEDRTTLKGDVTTQGSIKSLEKAYLDSTDQWELKLRAKSALNGAQAWTIDKVGTGASLIAQSVAFMIPGVALSMWQSYMGNKDEVKTLKETQTFGNILMKLPDDFINYDQPQSSKFVYVGLPTTDTALTEEFLSSANYYVTKPSFGQPGSVAITDPNFSGQMIHLNTGYVFMGNGAAADVDNPTLPFFETAASKSSSLVKIIEQLSAGMSSGGLTSDVAGNFSGLVASTQANYKGNQTIAYLFTPKQSTLNTPDAVPPLLSNTFKCLQNGTKFGPFNLQGLTDLPESIKRKISSINTSNAPQSLYDGIAYVAKGMYIYQTQDTPLIKSVLATIDDTALKTSLKDYLVLLDSEANYAIVPLEIPLPSPLGGHFAEYRLPLQAKKTYYLMSLLDFSVYGTDFSIKNRKVTGFYGTPNVIDPATYLEKNFAQYPSVVRQIQQVRDYVTTQKKYGPFKQGAISLSIDKALADQELFVYKWAASLENQADDYVVALQVQAVPNIVQPCLVSLSLPSERVNLFLSLVTSRFYDANLNPYQPPLYPYSNYYIVAPKEDPSALSVINYGTKRQPDTTMIVYAAPAHPLSNEKTHSDNDASAPLFSLFMDGDINPNSVPTLSNQPTQGVNLSVLPVPLLWALNSNVVLYEATKEPMVLGEVIKKGAPTLYSTIVNQHAAWKTWMVSHNPKLVAQQMGPYAFSESLVHTLYLHATSAADIAHGNHVYTSPDYPEHYLVMINDLSLSGLGEQFNNQQYALSLSTGAVYDGHNQGAPLSNYIDMATINNALQQLSLLDPLKQAIENSQHYALHTLQSHLIGADIDFGPFELYLNHTDFYNKQYIYAKINGLNVLNQDGTENKVQLANINDYVVCYDHATKKFGMPMSGSVDYVVSLVSGIVYNRAGTYVGTLDEVSSDSVDTMKATQNIVESIEQSSSKPLRAFLVDALKKLTKDSIDRYEKEQQILMALKKQDSILSEPLSSNVVANCMSAPYIAENPLILPQRYLKKIGQRYYRVLKGADKKVNLIIDYAAHPTAQIGSDQDCAIIYSNAKKSNSFYPISSVHGQALIIMRRAAGIQINAQAQQSLTLPSSSFGLTTTSMIKLSTKESATIYYNPATDLYYAEHNYNGVSSYVSLLDGQVYLLDGSACQAQEPVYTNDNALLYEGVDSAGLNKFMLRLNKGPYCSYSTIQSYPSRTQMKAWSTNGDEINWTSVTTNKKNVLNYGILYITINDAQPSERVRIIKVIFDENNQVLAKPYFVVENTDQTLVHYTQSTNLSLSVLSYAQTRVVGSKEGIFVAADMRDPVTNAYHLLAVVLNKITQRPAMLIYDTQVIRLSSAHSVKLSSSGLVASFKQDAEKSWISINNGKQAFDYLYSYAYLPVYGACGATETSLSCIQQSLGLYVTPFIDRASVGKKSYEALVNPLSTLLSVPPIKNSKKSITQNLIAKERSKTIRVDQNAVMYTAFSQKSSPTQRFVICLTAPILKECGIQDKSLVGAYADLYNGIVYYASIPCGRCLTMYQLQRLTNWLGIQLIPSANDQQPLGLAYS